LILFFAGSLIFAARQESRNFLSVNAGAFFPLGYYSDKFETGKSAGLNFSYYPDWADNLFLEMEASAALYSVKGYSKEKYSFFPVGLNVSYHVPFGDLFFIPFRMGGGPYILNMTQNGSLFNYYFKAGTGLFCHVSGQVQLGLNLDYHILYDKKPFHSFSTLVSASYLFGEPESVDGLKISEISVLPIFAAQYSRFYKRPIGEIKIENVSGKSLEDIKVSVYVKNFMIGKTESLQKMPVLKEHNRATLSLYAYFDKNIKYLNADTNTSGLIEIEYKNFNGQKFSMKKTFQIQILNKNSINWSNMSQIGSFITFEDKPVIEFARKAVQLAKNQNSLPENISQALKIFQMLKSYGLKYVPDPKGSYRSAFDDSTQIDWVQFPRETLIKKTGNCDDFSVLFASLLESVGILTAIVAVPEHVFMLFETRHKIPGKTVFFEGKNWVPIETTFLNQDFVSAWEKGYQNYFLFKEKQVKTVLEVTSEYSPATFENDIEIYVPVKQFEFEKTYQEEMEKILKFLK